MHVMTSPAITGEGHNYVCIVFSLRDMEGICHQEAPQEILQRSPVLHHQCTGWKGGQSVSNNNTIIIYVSAISLLYNIFDDNIHQI